MKILTMHSDFIEFQAVKKALKTAADADTNQHRIEECLVVFIGVEKSDEKNPKAITENLVKEVKDVAAQVSAKKIVLYPWVHLTQTPSSPSIAKEILDNAAKTLKAVSAPFGYYKKFNISVKGHPLAELSREITAEAKQDKSDTALAAEDKIKSQFFIMEPNGKMHELKSDGKKVSGFNFAKHKKLEKFALYELTKSRVYKQEPPHIRIMKDLELADYEPGSDPGNMRFYPKGRFIKSLLEQYTTQKIVEYGAMEIESPIMYDINHPTFKAYLERFPARHYVVTSPEKKLFLRFSACFGQFLMAKDMTISYKDLPIRLYELTRYSFRAEKHGELTGLKRLRAFTMPDCHAMCADMGSAKKELLVRHKLLKEIETGIGFDLDKDFELGLRITKQFLEKNADVVKTMVKDWKKPALVEVWPKQYAYFTFKYGMNFVDALDKASEINTDQIDNENGERYGITFTDKAGKKQTPLILHLSPGAIERIMYALLEKAAMGNRTLPLWLAPTQVRLCPVSDEFVPLAEKISKEIGFRCDIDDRDLSIPKKVREAEKEWVPAVIVIGEKEKGAKEFQVRLRGAGQKIMTLATIKKVLEKECSGKPFRPLPLPKMLSKRPKFFG